MPAHAAGPIVLAPGKNVVKISQPYKALGLRLVHAREGEPVAE